MHDLSDRQMAKQKTTSKILVTRQKGFLHRKTIVVEKAGLFCEA